jgi:hypothetical protein
VTESVTLFTDDFFTAEIDEKSVIILCGLLLLLLPALIQDHPGVDFIKKPFQPKFTDKP